jgi:hypothetical protein
MIVSRVGGIIAPAVVLLRFEGRQSTSGLRNSVRAIPHFAHQEFALRSSTVSLELSCDDPRPADHARVVLASERNRAVLVSSFGTHPNSVRISEGAVLAGIQPLRGRQHCKIGQSDEGVSTRDTHTHAK